MKESREDENGNKEDVFVLPQEHRRLLSLQTWSVTNLIIT